MKIYKHSANPIMEKESLVQSRVPDIAELARLLKRAQGENRTMAEFAKECKVSPSTFSRILNGKITQPLAYETLKSIWENSAPEAKVYFTDLILANGMVTKNFMEQKERRYPGSFSLDESRFSTERQIKNIIMEELLDRGLAVERQRRIHADEKVPSLLSGAGRSGMILRIKGYEPKYWKIKAMTYCGIKRGFYGDEPVPEIDYECEADLMFHHEAETFLLDSWEPDRTKKVKMSYAFTDEETLEAFERNLRHAKLNGYFSLILVDKENQMVVAEKNLQRKDGSIIESLFSLPVQTESNEWHDSNLWPLDEY